MCFCRRSSFRASSALIYITQTFSDDKRRWAEAQEAQMHGRERWIDNPKAAGWHSLAAAMNQKHMLQCALGDRSSQELLELSHLVRFDFKYGRQRSSTGFCCVIINPLFCCLCRALAAEQDLGVPGTWSSISAPDHATGRRPWEALCRCQEYSVLP